MYRILPKKLIVLTIAQLGIGVFLLLELLFNANPRIPFAALLVWGVVNGIAWKPVWQCVWRRFPILSEKIFPDLNGEWDVTLNSNWSRIQQLQCTAKSGTGILNMETCPDTMLAPLSSVNLRAKIHQTWFGFEMRIFNPAQNSPIQDSETIVIEPIAPNGLRRAGICYLYSQRNQTDVLTDDACFDGAARLEYDADSDSLDGYFWTNRMWRRGMCTAGTITFMRRRNEI